SKAKNLHHRVKDFWRDIIHNSIRVLWYSADDCCKACGELHSSAHWRKNGCVMIQKILREKITTNSIVATFLTWHMHIGLKHDLDEDTVKARTSIGLDYKAHNAYL